MVSTPHVLFGDSPLGTGYLSDTHSEMHGRSLEVWDNVKAYGALGDDLTDDTAAFEAAEAAGTGNIYVPAGTYRLDNYTPSGPIAIRGAGIRNTVLKAKNSSTYAMTIEGGFYYSVRELSLDGNAKTAGGLRLLGGAALSSQGQLFDSVRFVNASVGIKIDTGTVNQVDKNVFMRCWFSDNTIGMWVNSPNAQEQQILGGSFDNCPTGLRLTTGTFTGRGIQFQDCIDEAILIDGAFQWLHLEDTIWEGSDYDIDSTNWPLYGVYLVNCFLQGTTKNIRITSNGAKLTAINSVFNQDILWDADSGVFYDQFNTFQSGAVWDPTAGVDNRRFTWSSAGLTVASGGPGASVNHLTATVSGLTIGTSGTTIVKHISGTKTWDPGSIATAGTESTTVTVTGAVPGNTVAVGFTTAVPAGMLFTGAVTSSDTVTVTLHNVAAANPTDLASGTLRADVWQH